MSNFYIKLLEQRIARLEEHLGLGAPPESEAHKALEEAVLKEYGETNSFIGALKKYRELTGSTLLEAKNFVDALRLKHNF